MRRQTYLAAMMQQSTEFLRLVIDICEGGEMGGMRPIHLTLARVALRRKLGQ